jgi:hypothetical protein
MRARWAMATGMLLAAAVPAAVAAMEAPASASPARTASTGAATTLARAASVTGGRQPGSSPVSLAITSMNPAWAEPGNTITVSGTVKNVSRTTFSHLFVQFDFAGTAVAGLSALDQDVAGSSAPLAFNQVPGHMSQPSTVLRPGQVSSWSISFPANELRMTAFGVYPLTAQLFNSSDEMLAYSNTFLPYVPASRGPEAKSVPAKQRIAWLWPMMDVPLASLPGQPDCSGSQVSALGASMASGGRLDELLDAGGQFTATDELTWAVDPALLEDASALSACPGAHAHAAATWLNRLKKTTAGQQLFVTPYADVSLALIRQGRTKDVSGPTGAVSLGRQLASQLLDRNVGATPAGLRTGSAATAWPPDYVSVPILQNLLEADGINTVVLPSGSVSGVPGTAFTTQAGALGQLKVLLSNSSLTQLLSTASGKPQLDFSTGQAFLAETALMAAQGSADPIVVAPPQHPLSWQPSASLATTLLTYTHTAPWLTPTSVADLAASATKSDPNLTMASGADSGSFSRTVLRELNAVGSDVTAVSNIAAKPGPTTQASLALADLESANWPAHGQAARLAGLSALASLLVAEQGQIRIVAGSRVTLGGLKGNFPVVIDNQLDFEVEVRLNPSISQPPGGGVTVSQKPRGMVVVPADHQITTTLHVQATQVGSTTITLQLLNRTGTVLATDRVVVQATQFGTFAMIILAAALGLFVLASAARAVRRGRPATPDNDDGAGQPGEIGGSQEPPEPDTVVPEPSELGAARTSGPL